METALALSSSGSLLNMLNAILIGVIVYWATNRFTYIANVIVYAIARSVIPIITTLIFAGMIGLSIQVSMGTLWVSILLLCIPNFIVGLLVIKIVEKIVNWFNSDTILWFIVSFAIVDSIISWLFVMVLGVFVR